MSFYEALGACNLCVVKQFELYLLYEMCYTNKDDYYIIIIIIKSKTGYSIYPAVLLSFMVAGTGLRL